MSRLAIHLRYAQWYVSPLMCRQVHVAVVRACVLYVAVSWVTYFDYFGKDGLVAHSSQPHSSPMQCMYTHA